MPARPSPPIAAPKLILIAATNEVGGSSVPAHQRGAAAADVARLVLCGIPLRLRSLEALWAHTSR